MTATSAPTPPLQSGLLPNQTVLLIAGVVIVLVLVVGFYLVRRRWSNSGGANKDSSAQRQSLSEERERYDVPLRTRVGGVPWEAKALGFAAFVFLTVVVYNVWQYMKTGSPAQMVYATETQMTVLAFITLFAGIGYERKRRAKYDGEIHVHYEADPQDGDSETVTETIHYNPQDVAQDEDGLVVHETNPRRVLGLFPTPRRIADDRRFRDGEVWRPPEDKIAHRLPSHARQVGANEWAFHTKGAQLNKSPNTLADVEYRPPWSLSSEQYMKIEADMAMMQGNVREMRTRNAHLNQQVRKLESIVDEHFNEDWSRFISIVQELAPLFGNNRQETKLQKFSDDLPGHSSRKDGMTEEQALNALQSNGNGGDD